MLCGRKCYHTSSSIIRVPTPLGKSWIWIFLENPVAWKALENDFAPGKSWNNILELRTAKLPLQSLHVCLTNQPLLTEIIVAHCLHG